ncbi:MAG: hypothetical protein ACPGU7_09305 [Gammaproteobacteria bacterium]
MLGEVVKLYRAADSIIDSGERRYVDIRLTLNDELHQLLCDLYEGSAIDHVKGAQGAVEPENIAQNSTEEYEVRLRLPHKNENGVFAWNMQEVLSYPKFRHELPSAVYLADENWMTGEEDEPVIYKKYVQSVEFISVLMEAAEHNTSLGNDVEMVFWDGDKCTIPIVYEKDDLKELSDLAEFCKEILYEKEKKERLALLRSAVLSLIKPVSEKDRLVHLFKNFDELRREYNDNYKLYVSKFSFKELLDDVKEKRMEYVGRLNDVISDAQNKILTIPLAMLLIGTQFTSKTPFIQNLGILVGAFIFSLVMTLVLINQAHTLSSVKDSMCEMFEIFKRKNSDLAGRFDKALEDLVSRYKHNQRVLWGVGVFVWFPTLQAIYLFYLYEM